MLGNRYFYELIDRADGEIVGYYAFDKQISAEEFSAIVSTVADEDGEWIEGELLEALARFGYQAEYFLMDDGEVDGQLVG